MKTFKIAHLYYDLLNLYGENGNIKFLKSRLEEQNIKVETHFISIENQIDFNKYDLYYIGTGSKENLSLALNHLSNYKNELKKAIDNNKYFLITGNSLSMFGKNIEENNHIEKGLNLFNYNCKIEEFRIVGDSFLKSNLIDQIIIGFQNRCEIITDFDNHLFETIKGTGNNPNTSYEGIHLKNFYGTFLLGPFLVRNPYFCDYLVKEICKSLGTIYTTPNKKKAYYKAYHEYLKNFFS